MKLAMQMRGYTIWWLDDCEFGQRICAWLRFGRVNTIVQKSEDSGVLNKMPHICTITGRNAWSSCLPLKIDKRLFTRRGRLICEAKILRVLYGKGDPDGMSKPCRVKYYSPPLKDDGRIVVHAKCLISQGCGYQAAIITLDFACAKVWDAKCRCPNANPHCKHVGTIFLAIVTSTNEYVTNIKDTVTHEVRTKGLPH